MNGGVVEGYSKDAIIETFEELLSIGSLQSISNISETRRYDAKGYEFDKFMERVRSGRVIPTFRKQFLWGCADSNVQLEIWFRDDKNPFITYNPMKKYSILHVHFHSKRTSGDDCCDVDFELVDAANIRHMTDLQDLDERISSLTIDSSSLHHTKSPRYKGPYICTGIEESDESFKIFPEKRFFDDLANQKCTRCNTVATSMKFSKCQTSVGECGAPIPAGTRLMWNCEECGRQSISQKIMSCPGKQCDGERSFAQWNWQRWSGRNPNLHRLLSLGLSKTCCDWWSGKEQIPRSNILRPFSRFSMQNILAELDQRKPHLGHVRALCVGINRYDRLRSLKNCGNDARLIASKLEADCDAAVIKKIDKAHGEGSGDMIDLDTMEESIKEFTDGLSKAAEDSYKIVLVFFAGHGIEINNNIYLLPSNFRLEYHTEERIAKHSVSFWREIFGPIKEATKEEKALVFFLDICRSTPAGVKPLDISDTDQTARMRRNYVWVTSAWPGDVAYDGSALDGNSKFTRALAKHLFLPGRGISAGIDDAVNDRQIWSSADGTSTQTPLRVGSIFSQLALTKHQIMPEASLSANPSSDSNSNHEKRVLAHNTFSFLNWQYPMVVLCQVCDRFGLFSLSEKILKSQVIPGGSFYAVFSLTLDELVSLEQTICGSHHAYQSLYDAGFRLFVPMFPDHKAISLSPTSLELNWQRMMDSLKNFVSADELKALQGSVKSVSNFTSVCQPQLEPPSKRRRIESEQPYAAIADELPIRESPNLGSVQLESPNLGSVQSAKNKLVVTSDATRLSFGFLRKSWGIALEIGSRFEVLWDMGDASSGPGEVNNTSQPRQDNTLPEQAVEAHAEGSDDPSKMNVESQARQLIWWGCELIRFEKNDANYGPVWVVRYDAKPSEGICAESSDIIFLGIDTLMDEDGDVKPWRNEISLSQACTFLKANMQLDIVLGMRMETLWDLTTSRSEEEVWWGCQLTSLLGLHPEYGPIWRLVYDSRGEISETQTRIAFKDGETVMDLDTVGVTTPIHWRHCEDTADDAGFILDLDSRVEFRDFSAFQKGRIVAFNNGGTCAIQFDEGFIDHHVQQKLIQPIVSDPVIATCIEEFFQQYVSSLLAGKIFQGFDPEKKKIAADLLASMRPFMEKGLEELAASRGPNSTVNGEDILAVWKKVKANASEELQDKLQFAFEDVGSVMAGDLANFGTIKVL